MKILIAGASNDTAKAVKVIAESVFSQISTERIERRGSGAVPRQSVAALRCSLCVVDVLGMGWSQWFPEHEARVELLLAGRGAILLLPPDSVGGWYASPRFCKRSDRILLRRPVSVAGINQALHTVGAEAARLDGAAYRRHLLSNIWMQHVPQRSSARHGA